MTSQHNSLGLILTFAPLKYIFLVFRPLEMSAKKPVPFLRQVVPVRKKVGAASPQFRTCLSTADRAHTWEWGCYRWHRLLLEDRAGPLGNTVTVFPWGEQGVGWSSCRLT